MKTIQYFIVCVLFATIARAQSIGIGTNSPTKTLDVNGETRVRLLPSGDMQNKNIITVDQDGNLYKTANIVVMGDLKSSLETTDHKGWYILNGRNISTLSSSARNVAISLGFTTTLPNAADRIIKTKTSVQALGLSAGNNTIVLAQANIPVYTMTATLSTTGPHTHTWLDKHTNSVGTQTVPDGGSYAHAHEGSTINTTSDGLHTHTATSPTGGSSTAFSLLPEYVIVNTFIYLGS